jgi:hypothetical protein
LSVVAGEVEDRVADDNIRAGIVERHMLDRFDAKIRCWKSGCKHPGEGADASHGMRVRIRTINLVPFPQEVDEVSTGTTSGVQYSHSGCDAAFQKLVEKVDVDLSKLLLERGHFVEISPTIPLRQVLEPLHPKLPFISRADIRDSWTRQERVQ